MSLKTTFLSVLTLVGALFFAASGYAQGVSYTGTPVALTRGGFPAAGAAVVVCAGNVTVTLTANPPCSPYATIYSDPALTVPIAQPGFKTDGLGNYPFFVAAGATYTIVIPTQGGFTGTSTVWNSPIIPSAQNNFTVLQTYKNLNNALVVDTSNVQGWIGTDFGAWLNNEYSTMPTPGGRSLLFCGPAATAVNFSTPVLFNTSGKYFKGQGMCTENQTGNGLGLNYTPTTATNAMTFDYTPAGGGGYAPSNGLSDVYLSNGAPCITNGGCGSNAIGIEFGNTNGGAHASDFTNVHVSGFGKAVDFNGTVGWGVHLNNFWCSWNTTCLNFTQYQENIHWFGGACAVNTTCVNNAIGAGLFTFGVSFDSSLTQDWTGGGVISAFGDWFENLGQSTFQITNQAGGTWSIYGSPIINDTTSGTPLAQLFTMTAGVFNFEGSISSPNQAITNVVNNTAGGMAHLKFSAPTPGNVLSGCSVPAACVVERLATPPAEMDIPLIDLPLDTFGTTGKASHVRCHMDAVNSDLRCSYNNDTFGLMAKVNFAATWTANQTNMPLITPTIGGGTTLTKYSRFSVSLTPVAVAANTCAAQSFTVTGIAAADILIAVSKPTEQAGLSAGLGHVTGANTATINFCNNTAAPITPTAAETYQFVAVQ